MVSRAELKSRAKEQLKGRWGLAIVVVLVYYLITQTSFAIETAVSKMDGFRNSMYINLIPLLLGGAISVGISRFLLNFSQREKCASFADLSSGFSIYLKALGLYLISSIIISIGFMFLVVPGLIASIMLSQAYYILAEDNSKSIMECLTESMTMMKGHKMDYFILKVSFIGWDLLCVLTMGIGLIWLKPYMLVTESNFYLELSK